MFSSVEFLLLRRISDPILNRRQEASVLHQVRKLPNAAVRVVAFVNPGLLSGWGDPAPCFPRGQRVSPACPLGAGQGSLLGSLLGCIPLPGPGVCAQTKEPSVCGVTPSPDTLGSRTCRLDLHLPECHGSSWRPCGGVVKGLHPEVSCPRKREPASWAFHAE